MAALLEQLVAPVFSNSSKHTAAELMNLPDDGKEYELIKGEFVELSGSSIKHGAIIAILGQYLRSYVTERDLGSVMSNTAFVLDPANAPRPDICVAGAVGRCGLRRCLSGAARFGGRSGVAH